MEMFRKKKVQQESNVKCFFGGAAVGMAAGLLFRKLLSNISDESTQNFEPEVLMNKNGNKYSQDDNIHNLRVEKNTHNCRTRSKSASQYEKTNNCTEQAKLSKKFDKDLKYDMNNLDINHKFDKSIQKNFYDNTKCTLYNISIEDNAKYNEHTKIMSKFSEDEKKRNNNEPSKPEETKNELEDNASITQDDFLTEINTESMNDNINNNNNNNNKQTREK